MTEIRIAVISDLHAYEEPNGQSAPSYLCIRDPSDGPGTNPIPALTKLIESEGLSADLLLCPGDLTDKAHPGSLIYAWDVINDLRHKLGASLLAATTGNHDVDSHLIYSRYEPAGALKRLHPKYPLPNADDAINDRYWSRGFTVVENDVYRLLVLNSSDHHSVPEEVTRGRVGDRALDEIKDAISGEAPGINILMCHHHPHQHMEIGLGEDDVMRSGQLLLDALGSGKYGRWLVIHGHKHHPKVTYAAGGSTSPVVFAAGSVSARLYSALATVARNQFYIISLFTNPHPAVPFGGLVDVWDWAAGRGWKKAGPDSGLPCRFGFGCRTDPVALAAQISTGLQHDKADWSDVVARHPEVEYLLPQDFALLRMHLANNYRVFLDPEYGVPQTIGRSV